MGRQVNSNDPLSGYPSKREFEEKAEISDADFTICNESNKTKKIQFDCSGVPAGTTVTLAPPPTSEVCVSHITTQGGTNTAVCRFGAVVRNNGGSDITYDDSSSLGATFTINTTGTYAISASGSGAQNAELAITVNATGEVLTTNDMYNTPASVMVAYSQVQMENGIANCSRTLVLTAGDIVRCQGSVATNGPYEQFSICRIH